MSASPISATADFDFQVGSWIVHHRRLEAPLTGGDAWREFEGGATAQILMNGAVSVDEIDLEGGETGMSFRVRDTASGAWTIYWVNSRDGRLQAPVTGSWRDGVFEGVGVDSYAGRQIVARYLWSDISETTARWEQAFSVDDGATWETNWVMSWRRDHPHVLGPDA
ncbi:MAG TPA: hypothetical protein VNQ53_13575 [Nocardioides sp.]|nr:hypothetical protein [Nocardioides sp.]